MSCPDPNRDYSDWPRCKCGEFLEAGDSKRYCWFCILKLLNKQIKA